MKEIMLTLLKRIKIKNYKVKDPLWSAQGILQLLGPISHWEMLLPWVLLLPPSLSLEMGVGWGLGAVSPVLTAPLQLLCSSNANSSASCNSSSTAAPLPAVIPAPVQLQAIPPLLLHSPGAHLTQKTAFILRGFFPMISLTLCSTDIFYI